MLTSFFIIVFAAEIVLAANIISLILKCDKKICELNNIIIENTPKIEKEFCSLRISVNYLNLKLNKIRLKIEQKKSEYKTIIFKYVITGILFLALNTSGRRIMSQVEAALSLFDLIKKIRKMYSLI